MSNLVSFLTMQIQALQDSNLEKSEENVELTTFIYELCQEDCPDDYKRVVMNAVFNLKPKED